MPLVVGALGGGTWGAVLVELPCCDVLASPLLAAALGLLDDPPPLAPPPLALALPLTLVLP